MLLPVGSGLDRPLARLPAAAPSCRNVGGDGRMSRVPWNFGGGPVSIGLRSRCDHFSRHKHTDSFGRDMWAAAVISDSGLD